MVIIPACVGKRGASQARIIKRMKTMNDQKEFSKKSGQTRFQEPKPPFPYHQEEVSYKNEAAGVTLAGTLTIPQAQGPFPAVLLISGMGPNKRDNDMMGHKMFLVLADYLTRQGIAVLRYDKRGVGKSTGTFDLTITSEDFADDALAGVNYLKNRKEINAKQMGLIGESEGGLIAAMVTVCSPDISFLVLMAPAVAMSTDNIVEHVAMQLRADGASEQLITLDGPMRRQVMTIAINEVDHDKAAQQMHAVIAQYLKELPAEIESEKLLFAITQSNAQAVISMFNSPWYRYLLVCNPAATLKQITIPVLAINGSHDLVTSSHIIHPIIAQALKEAGNNDVTIRELPNLNHSLQTCKTGSLMEYGTTEETIAPIALRTIADWLLARIQPRK